LHKLKVFHKVHFHCRIRIFAHGHSGYTYVFELNPRVLAFSGGTARRNHGLRQSEENSGLRGRRNSRLRVPGHLRAWQPATPRGRP
jgi:hypothetical protein